MVARTASTRNIEKNNTGISNPYHNSPFHVNQNSNVTLAIIGSNRREENQLIIQYINYDKDNNNNKIFNINEV